MRQRLALLSFLTVAAVSIARASDLGLPLPNIGPPLLLRLEGLRAPSATAARKIGFTAVSLGFPGDDSRLWLGVNDARTVGGDHALDGKDVLAALAPYEPTLMVAGTPDLVSALRNAPDDAPIVVEGLVLRASRMYYLRSVVAGAAD